MQRKPTCCFSLSLWAHAWTRGATISLQTAADVVVVAVVAVAAVAAVAVVAVVAETTGYQNMAGKMAINKSKNNSSNDVFIDI